MKNKKAIFITLGVIVVAALVIVNLTSESSSGTKVNAAEVTSTDLVEKVSASGRIQPKTKVDITAEINGEIVSLPVREGQRVDVGDLLVVLDTVQLASDAHQARYRLDETRARMEGAQTTLDQSQEEYQRQERLFEKNLTSERFYKDSKYAYLSAKSNHQAMKSQIQQGESAYAKQLDYLSRAKIVAPMAGIITYLDVEVGEIAAAQTAFTQGRTLMTISDLNVFEVEVEVDETEINKIELAQAAEIEVDAFPDTTFPGEVVEIGNTAIMSGLGTQDQSTNFRVKVTFSDANLKVRPGMSATVDITSAEETGVLAVPFASVVVRTYDLDSLLAARVAEDEEVTDANAVHAAETVEGEETDDDKAKEEKERDELKGVFVVKEGVARFVQVETGVADQKNIMVTRGIEAGDSVISGPYRVLRTIKDGDEVEVEEKRGAGNDEGEA
ncbi:MAG: efflux RND transporter periplasmic adaptor subunit [bacterium]|nr:efflux RND transporter periplasmic adaptor subunit [bacterium]